MVKNFEGFFSVIGLRGVFFSVLIIYGNTKFSDSKAIFEKFTIFPVWSHFLTFYLVVLIFSPSLAPGTTRLRNVYVIWKISLNGSVWYRNWHAPLGYRYRVVNCMRRMGHGIACVNIGFLNVTDLLLNCILEAPIGSKEQPRLCHAAKLVTSRSTWERIYKWPTELWCTRSIS